MLKLKEQISTTVKRMDEEFKKPFKLGKGSCNMYETLLRINCYLNDQFYLPQDDDAIFWNISSSRVIHFAKNIDLDTKDLMPIGKGDTNFLKAWILRLRFLRWIRENKLSLTLNDLSEGVSSYGSICWKLCNDLKKKEKTLEECEWLNMRFNPTAKTIRQTPVVYFHYLDEIDIQEKEGAWDNIPKILKNARKADGSETETKENKYMKREIWEFHGQVMGEDGKAHYMHYIGAGYGDKEVIGFEEEIKPEDSPYYDFHLGRYRGRLIRIGVVERLFRLQERTNAVVNQNAESTQIASLLLMRTEDSNTTGNVLRGAINGEIINSKDLQQVGISNTAFNVLLTELDRIERQADKLCMTPEVVTGDYVPLRVNKNNMAAMKNSATSAFAYTKQRIGEAVGFLIEDKILPSVVKNWNRGEMFDIIDNLQDINLYDDLMIMDKVIEYVKKANEQGKYVPDEEIAQLEEDYRTNIEKSGRTIETPKDFFNFKFGLKLNVTGESFDLEQQNEAFNNIMNWKQANPEVVNDPYFRQYCENNGITPIRMSRKQIAEQTSGLSKGKPAEMPMDKISQLLNAKAMAPANA